MAKSGANKFPCRTERSHRLRVAPWEASETDGAKRRSENSTERERRSQQLEISVENPALGPGGRGIALRVALEVKKNPFNHCA